ncbi:MAG: VWA domain-containing protein [Phycisphaerales bacterium]|nr:VWA domain-containing protein [Phycisphaerales bacterium]
MTWLTPLAGLLLAAAVIPPLVLLYFLRLRRRPMPIASTLLWRQATEDLRANAPFQRLRFSILLLLQLLALALLAFAIAQPQVDAGSRRGGRTVILVDNSASMNATDGGEDRTRLQQAKRLARGRIERLFGGGIFGGDPGEVMVIAFSDRAEVRTPFTDSRSQLLAAIEGIQPTDGTTRLEEALALARAFTTNVDPDAKDRPVEQPAALELYSDGEIADLSEQVLRGGESLEYTVVGDPETANVAIVGVAADRPYDRPGTVQVFVSVANFGPEPAEVDVQLAVDGVVRAITPKPVKLAAAGIDPTTSLYQPGREQVVFLPFEQARDALVEVSLLHQDDFPVDDRANMVLPPARRLKVALVDPKGFFLREVLVGLEGVMIERLDILSADDFAKLVEEDRADEYDVVVLDDVVPKQMPKAARILSFGSAPPVEGLNEYGIKEHVLVRALRGDHPIFRFADLDDLYVSRMHTIAPGSDVQVLAEAAEGPLVVAVSRGALSLVHVTFNPLDTNGPFGRSLVNMVCNAVEFLGNTREAIASDGLRAGQAITARVPATADDLKITLPDGTSEPVTATDTSVSWGPVRSTGVYELSWTQPGESGRVRRRFAVNLLSDQESRVAARPEVKLGEDRVAGAKASDAVQTPLWPWALGACLALLMVEWWMYRERTG